MGLNWNRELEINHLKPPQKPQGHTGIHEMEQCELKKIFKQMETKLHVKYKRSDHLQS